MKQQSQPKIEIPSWIFFAVSYAIEPRGRWDDAKQALAEKLTKTLRIRADELAIPDNVREKLFEFNDFDDVSMYSHREIKKK
jgi:hypothetical protein